MMRRLIFLTTTVITLGACGTVSNFNSWAPEQVEAANYLAVFAPADSYADARKLESLYCRHVLERNPVASCEPITNYMPAGQAITEDMLAEAVSNTSATHLVSIDLLDRIARTSTHGTLIGDFVWGHNFHHDENLHQVQVLELASNELVYSAQLRSHSGAALTRHAYLVDVTRRIVRSQEGRGVLLAP